jgi:hypothetical protein
MGSVASLAANVAVAEPTLTGRVIAAWPSFALIAAYELLMRQVSCAADAGQSRQRASRPSNAAAAASAAGRTKTSGRRSGVRRTSARDGAGRELQLRAWRWAQANRADDGSLPAGRDIARQYGRQERWGRLVKRSGLADELST